MLFRVTVLHSFRETVCLISGLCCRAGPSYRLQYNNALWDVQCMALPRCQGMISITSERFSFPVILPMTSLFPLSQINSTVSLPGGGSGPPEDVKPPVLGVRGLHCPPPPGGPGAGKRLCAICGDRSSGMGLETSREEERVCHLPSPVGFPVTHGVVLEQVN